MSIIAISGRKSSGKDLVGKITQYLLIDWCKVIENYDIDKPLTFEQYQNSAFNGANLSGWEIKKFADKLKEIVALLIGCSREDLENEEFKSKELGKEWWFYKNRYGKLVESYKDVNSDTLNKWKKNSEFYELVKPTPRFLLQYIGTDLFRNQLQPNVWVNSLINEYKPKYVGGIDPTSDSNIKSQTFKIYPNWIITDLRFQNELKAVKENGGITIRINRKIFKYNDDISYVTNPIFDTKQHISETELDNEKFDYHIDNNGTVDELIEKVREILIKEKLL